MSADGYEEIIQVQSGEVLVEISRTDVHAADGKRSWIGTISCRKCITESFRELFYIVDEDIKKVKEHIREVLKNVFYKQSDN